MPRPKEPALLIGTDDGLHQLLPEPRVLLPDEKVTAIATSGEAVWCITDERTVRRQRHGTAFKPIFELTDRRLTCLGLTSHGVFIGTSGAHLLRIKNKKLGMMHSFDRVAGRSDWFSPDSDEADTRSIAQSESGAVFVNVHVGGIPRSTTGGDTWKPTIDIEQDVHQVIAHPKKEGLILAAAAVGLCVSDDDGDTWTVRNDGLHGDYCRAVALCRDTVLVTASTGPRSRRGAVYHTSLNPDDTLETCERGLPDMFPGNIDTGCLAALGDRAAFGTKEGEVYQSLDAGESWTRIAASLPRVRAVAYSG